MMTATATAMIRRNPVARRSALAGLCLALCLSALWAQSSGTLVTFPRFFADDTISGGIAIFNPNNREASVVLTLRDFDGSFTASVINPVTVRVPALGQLTRTASELFGSSFTRIDASLEASSSTSGLVIVLQTFDFDSSFTDGAEAPQAGMELIFPVVPTSREGLGEIDLVNPNGRTTAVDLRLVSFDGEVLGKAVASLLPGGNFADLASRIFPAGTSFQNASHVIATSRSANVFSQGQTISGTSLFFGFPSLTTSGRFLDVAALNALTLTQTSAVGVIPHFRTGSQNASTLALVNAETASIDVNLTAVGNTGTTLATRRVTLKANGGFREPIQTVFTALASGEREGWILVSATGRVAAAVIFGRSDDGALAAAPMQARAQSRFAFPQIAQGNGMSTELTLVNSGSRSATADVFVVTPAGVTLTNSPVTVGPSSRVSRRIDLLLPEITTQVGGAVFVRSTEPLFGLLQISEDTGAALSSFNPASVPSGYSPANQTVFGITGTVTLNGLPVEGFSVVLSGAATKTTTTSSTGTFAFTGLPAGKFTLSVDAPGIVFTPATASIEITTTSRQQNFVAVTASNTIVALPGSLAVRSPDTTISIFGNDFNSSSVAFLDDTRLKTTFVDRTQLRVVIPSFLLATPAIFDLTVNTDGKVTRPFAFTAFQERPTLTSVSTTDVLVEGSQGKTITVRGTGFLEGAKVKVNGTSEGIVISALNETRIEAFLPSSFFVKAGVFPVSVENPFPVGSESTTQLLTVFHPAPVVEEILPKSTSVRLEPGLGALDLEVLGYGFRRGAVVNLGGVPLVTTYCEQSAYCLSVHLYAKVPASTLGTSGIFEVRVDNPDPSLAPSEVALLRVEGLQPTITSVLPGAATALDLPRTFRMPVVVDGTNFGPQTLARIYATGSIIDFGVPTEILSTHQLVYTVPAIEYSPDPAEWNVEVMNPPPGGGKSEPVKFTINPGNFVQNPFLISVTPQTVAAGGSVFTLTVNGTNFINGSQIHFNGSPLVTTVVSSTQVRADVPASLIRAAGRYSVTVLNPDNGGDSNKLFVDVR